MTSQITPEWVGVSTGDSRIDEAFRISVRLVDDLRRQYYELGGVQGWLPVSGGIRGPGIHVTDTRDSAHAVKMAAYLWGHEVGQAATIEKAFFLDVVNAGSGALEDPGQRKCDVVKQHAPNTGMQLRCAADGYRYFAPGPQFAEALRRAALTADWVQKEYDAEESGLLDCRNGATTTFWGAHLGEPDHYPPNYDPKNKAIGPTMAYCVWLQTMERVARLAGAREAEALGRHHKRVRAALEERAWSERGGYYYTQIDRIADKNFFSLNGQSERSRETDVIPYYAAEGEIAPERLNAVARWIDNALWRDRVFPMPIFYPPYTWYSPGHPNYIDHGDAKSVIGGAWDTPYFHCVELLREAGLVDTLELAVRKRAEAIVRDGDCIEWYHLDGTVDNATGFHRDRYLVSATAQIAATIEGLFGVTPAAGNFEEINIAPALPLFRRYRHTAPPAPYAERDNTLSVTLPEGRRLDLAIRYGEADEIVRVRTNAAGMMAHFRLPIDLASRLKHVCWAGWESPYRIERKMEHDFVCVSHVLDGGELTLHLRPHPQKGLGTTPSIEMLPAGGVVIKGAGSGTPSPACGRT